MKGFWNSLMLLAAMLAAGCATEPQPGPGANATAPQTAQSDVQTLREGDSIRISFPGAQALDVASQQIRPDGRISMTLIGEVYAAGLKPAELEKLLEEKYASQLRSNDVTAPAFFAACIPSMISSAVVSESAAKIPPLWNQRTPLPKMAFQSKSPGFNRAAASFDRL